MLRRTEKNDSGQKAETVRQLSRAAGNTVNGTNKMRGEKKNARLTERKTANISNKPGKYNDAPPVFFYPILFCPRVCFFSVFAFFAYMFCFACLFCQSVFSAAASAALTESSPKFGVLKNGRVIPEPSHTAFNANRIVLQAVSFL